TTALLLDVFIIYAAARLGGELFERLGQPAVLGELLVGIAIGPHALGLIGRPDAMLMGLFGGDPGAATQAVTLLHDLLAEIGVVVLLFYVGLNTPIDAMLRAGPRAVAIAVLGETASVVAGVGLMRALGYPEQQALLLGTALAATSVAI